jgi:hypothetical protein
VPSLVSITVLFRGQALCSAVLILEDSECSSECTEHLIDCHDLKKDADVRVLNRLREIVVVVVVVVHEKNR